MGHYTRVTQAELVSLAPQNVREKVVVVYPRREVESPLTASVPSRHR